MTDFADARRKMVDNQLRTTDVTHRGVLEAMGDVARERFVPARLGELAYLDREITLKPGRSLGAPSALARLVQLADPRETERVLLVGAASGYSAAVLARLAGSVVALESDAELVAQARESLAGLTNVEIVAGPLAAGQPARGPFDLIIVDGAVAEAPQSLFDQLADRGRLVVTEGAGPTAAAKVYVRDGAVVSARRAFNLGLPALSEFSREPSFAF